jgi:hypothetical protein
MIQADEATLPHSQSASAVPERGVGASIALGDRYRPIAVECANLSKPYPPHAARDPRLLPKGL